MIDETWHVDFYYGAMFLDFPDVNIWSVKPKDSSLEQLIDDIVIIDGLLEVGGCLDSPAEHQWHLNPHEEIVS